MTANLTIVSQEKDGVLYIPQRAVKVREAVLGVVPEKYVQILVNGKSQEKTVVIGLRGDNGLVEVLSGLTEGEQVITFSK
jgi:multidrug efflux pump subunit AcrA (membrane-fusion protein)